MPPPRRPKVTDISAHVTCPICEGYLVDATSIVECLHAFCRTCIVRYLESSKFCPVCEVQVHHTRPLLGIRPDQTLQDLVYKIVPDLYQSEMRKRKEFYAQHPDADACHEPEARGEGDPRFFSAGESFSLSLQMLRSKEPESRDVKDPTTRHLKCPAALTVGHLKKFVRLKFSLPTTFAVEVFYDGDPLRNSWTLMDVAYIYSWKRAEPMKFFYTLTRRVPKPAVDPPPSIHDPVSAQAPEPMEVEQDSKQEGSNGQDEQRSEDNTNNVASRLDDVQAMDVDPKTSSPSSPPGQESAAPPPAYNSVKVVSDPNALGFSPTNGFRLKFIHDPELKRCCSSSSSGKKSSGRKSGGRSSRHKAAPVRLARLAPYPPVTSQQYVQQRHLSKLVPSVITTLSAAPTFVTTSFVSTSCYGNVANDSSCKAQAFVNDSRTVCGNIPSPSCSIIPSVSDHVSSITSMAESPVLCRDPRSKEVNSTTTTKEHPFVSPVLVAVTAGTVTASDSIAPKSSSESLTNDSEANDSRVDHSVTSSKVPRNDSAANDSHLGHVVTSSEVLTNDSATNDSRLAHITTSSVQVPANDSAENDSRLGHPVTSSVRVPGNDSVANDSCLGHVVTSSEVQTNDSPTVEKSDRPSVNVCRTSPKLNERSSVSESTSDATPTSLVNGSPVPSAAQHSIPDSCAFRAEPHKDRGSTVRLEQTTAGVDKVPVSESSDAMKLPSSGTKSTHNKSADDPTENHCFDKSLSEQSGKSFGMSDCVSRGHPVEFDNDLDLGCQPDLVVDESQIQQGRPEEDSCSEDDDLRKKINAIAEGKDDDDVTDADSGRASDMSCSAASPAATLATSVAPSAQSEDSSQRTAKVSSIEHVIKQLYLQHEIGRSSSSSPHRPKDGDSGGQVLDLSTCGTRKPGEGVGSTRPKSVANPPVLDFKHRQQTYLPAPVKQHTACPPAPKHPTSLLMNQLTSHHHPSILQAQLTGKSSYGRTNTPISHSLTPPSAYSFKFSPKAAHQGGIGMFSNLPYSSMMNFGIVPARMQLGSSHPKEAPSKLPICHSPSKQCPMMSGRHHLSNSATQSSPPSHPRTSPSSTLRMSPHHRSPAHSPKNVSSGGLTRPALHPRTSSSPHLRSASPVPSSQNVSSSRVVNSRGLATLHPRTSPSGIMGRMSPHHTSTSPAPSPQDVSSSVGGGGGLTSSGKLVGKKANSKSFFGKSSFRRSANLAVFNPDPNGFRQKLVIKNLDSSRSTNSTHH